MSRCSLSRGIYAACRVRIPQNIIEFQNIYNWREMLIGETVHIVCILLYIRPFVLDLCLGFDELYFVLLCLVLLNILLL